ncbi:MAG: endonuclease MutS2 [Eubacteriales bacterium]
MEYASKAIRILEFDKVIEQLTAFVRTESGKEAAKALEPSSDTVTVKRRLAETSKAKELIAKNSMPSFGNGKNVLNSVDRALKGATLMPIELLEIRSVLRNSAALSEYPPKNFDLGALTEYFEAIRLDRHLEKAIGDAIIAEDMIADTASDNLYRIRREIRKCESDIRETLSKYTSGSYSKYLQENIVTQRNGRFVVPVRAEFKNEIKGLVHDTSSSGATLFIEPLQVLEGNNRLRELKNSEAEEIEKILSALSDMVAKDAEIIATNYKVIRDLSLIFGKADYSFEIRGVSPVINERNRSVKLLNARHPLLDKEKVVPITVTLGGKNDAILVITGPNTGGKTVTLKTIGLMALMAQSGLEVPCDFGTTLPVFDEILPDIGDEQSIEQSLSTFSAHMTNIVGIVQNSSCNSLVLFDELGAGTDPTEGAALAVAILEDMKRIGATVAATTHYAELKTYALESEGVMNASCEFDVETLRPTYRLVTGLPGKSNAFAIARRLGLPDRIIEKAKSAMGEESIRFEDVLSRLEETQNKLSKEREHIEKLRREAEEKLKQAEEYKEKVQKDVSNEADRAREQANRILAQAKASSDYIFAELNKIKKEAEKDKKFDNLEQARLAVREQLKKADKATVAEDEDDDREYIPPRDFRIGDEVIIASINKKGYIEAIDGENASVKAGIITTKVRISDLRLVETQKAKEVKKSTATYSHPAEAVKNEVDVRGLTGDDAYFVIDRYLDTAMLAGYRTISIIHGKGTGALRAAVWEHLKHDKRVRSYRSGRYGEGDTGVTVVELKVD